MAGVSRLWHRTKKSSEVTERRQRSNRSDQDLDYLLAVDHPEGAGKAAFFLRFGFTIDDWQTFAGALISHARFAT